MGSDDVQKLYDMLCSMAQRLTVVETLLKEQRAQPLTVDVSCLRWDAKALTFVITRIVAPTLITVIVGGSAFYYGISAQFDSVSAKIGQHIKLTER